MASPKVYAMQVSFDREPIAVRFIYRFITCGKIFNPECSFSFLDRASGASFLPYNTSSMPMSLSDFPDLMSLDIIEPEKDDKETERKFRARINEVNPDFIYCTGSFDKENRKRISVRYHAGSYKMNISFSPNNLPTKRELSFLKSLFDDF